MCTYTYPHLHLFYQPTLCITGIYFIRVNHSVDLGYSGKNLPKNKKLEINTANFFVNSVVFVFFCYASHILPLHFSSCFSNILPLFLISLSLSTKYHSPYLSFLVCLAPLFHSPLSFSISLSVITRPALSSLFTINRSPCLSPYMTSSSSLSPSPSLVFSTLLPSSTVSPLPQQTCGTDVVDKLPNHLIT